MDKIRVVAGILTSEGRVLAAQRGAGMRHPGKWEFPGGKVEAGEDDSTALIRELEEELSITVEVERLLMEHTHSYPDQTICLVGLMGRIVGGEPKAIEHACVKWVTTSELSNLDWSDADRPLVQAILERL